MTYIKNVRMGILILVFAFAIGAFSQLYSNTNTFAANTLPGSNEVITIGGTTDGQPVNAQVYAQAYSGDNNVILFSSSATNLPNAGGSGGLYTYNIKSGVSSRVDISTSGATANGNFTNGTFQLSETGRYVTFVSMATNLIDGSTQPQRQFYKRDTQAGTTSFISGDSSNGTGQPQDRNLGISNDGRFILVASRYLANTYPYYYGIVVGDTANNSINWTSLGNLNYDGVDDMKVGDASCDGSFVVFQKYRVIYLADLRKGSVATLALGNDNSTAPIISCDGRYILYATQNRTDISPTPAGLNANLHLVRYDRITGERQYIDSNSSNVFSNGFNFGGSSAPLQDPFYASVADTGDVAFVYNNYGYIKHLSDGSGTLESIGKKQDGTYVNVPGGRISNDGRYILFGTDPYNLGLAPSPSSSQIIRAKTGL